MIQIMIYFSEKWSFQSDLRSKEELKVVFVRVVLNLTFGPTAGENGYILRAKATEAL